MRSKTEISFLKQIKTENFLLTEKEKTRPEVKLKTKIVGEISVVVFTHFITLRINTCFKKNLNVKLNREKQTSLLRQGECLIE